MTNAGAGLAAGLRSSAAAVYSVAQSIAANVRSTIERALQIASPSKVMRRIGSYTVEGMALGMEDLIPRVASAAGAVAAAAERNAAAVLPAPVSYSAAQNAGEPLAAVTSARQDGQSEFAALGERIDRLLDYLSGTETVLQLDGRAFGRMIREYS